MKEFLGKEIRITYRSHLSEDWHTIVGKLVDIDEFLVYVQSEDGDLSIIRKKDVIDGGILGEKTKKLYERMNRHQKEEKREGKKGGGEEMEKEKITIEIDKKLLKWLDRWRKHPEINKSRDEAIDFLLREGQKFGR